MAEAAARAYGDPAARAPAWPEGTRGRIMLAAVRVCEDFGLRRTTVDDVARRAGLSRATLYRYFDSKDALVQAVILAEAERFFAAVDVALAGLERSEERVVEGFAFGLRYVRAHALLGKLLRAEPETLLPYLLGESRLITVATEAVARRIPGEDDDRPFDAEDARSAAELVVRLVLSLALSPDSSLDVDDAAGARRLARRYLVPGLLGR